MSKNKGKTVEELLQEALVPVEEQPYPIPENWVWVYISELINKMEPKYPNKLDSNEFHYIDVDSIDNKNQRVREVKSVLVINAPSRARRSVRKNDVIISLVRPYLRNIALIEEEDEWAIASTAFYVCRSNGRIVPRFLYEYLRGVMATSFLNSYTKGDNSPSVKSTDFEKMPIPLPPLDEQKRIADKVERLLNKINQAKQLIEEAKETFELRRAAILDKAIRGDLTAKWRQENTHIESAEEQLNKAGVQYKKNIFERIQKIPKNSNEMIIHGTWEVIDLGNVCVDSFYGPRFSKDDYALEGIPTIRTTDMTKNGEIILKNPPKVNVDENKLQKFKLEQGDLLVTRTGSIGTMAVFDEAYVAIPSAYLIRFRFNTIVVDPRYVFYYLSSTRGQAMLGLGATAITQPNINAETIKMLPMVLPPIQEQKRIVAILDKYLDEERQIEEKMNQLSMLENLQATILNNAFQGKLGTNEQDDGNAKELLRYLLVK